ncbi:hypothetical protein PG994_014999 [Apiospora phragmitis]|uniref:AA1-like domain-containing protein n=1 Tax=Apiospora phragmitis TaxID=2905665 RepID=A0ABR1SV78_9PEZI
MKFATGTLFALAAAGIMASPVPAAAAGPIEQIIVNDFVRTSLPGEPTTVHFSLLDHSITCDSEALAEYPSERFTCTDPAYTFLVLDSPNPNSWTLEIQHRLNDGTELAGSFHTGCNGPLFTICWQIGTASFALVQRD